MLAGKLSRKQIAWGYLFAIPAYLYYIPTIVTYLIYQLMIFNVIGNNATSATILLNFFIGIVSLVLLLVLMYRYLLENIRAFKKNIWNNLMWTITTGLPILYGLSILGGLIIILVLGEDAAANGSSNQQLFESLQTGGPIIMFIQAVIFAPVVEELIFRGIIFRSLYDKNKYMAHIVSAVAFGFVHIISFLEDWTQLVYVFMYIFMGLGLSYCYQKKGNIIVPIILHGINNGVAFFVAML